MINRTAIRDNRHGLSCILQMCVPSCRIAVFLFMVCMTAMAFATRYVTDGYGSDSNDSGGTGQQIYSWYDAGTFNENVVVYGTLAGYMPHLIYTNARDFQDGYEFTAASTELKFRITDGSKITGETFYFYLFDGKYIFATASLASDFLACVSITDRSEHTVTGLTVGRRYRMWFVRSDAFEDDIAYRVEFTPVMSTQAATLSSISINGSSTVSCDGAASYTCSAIMSDGTTRTVSPTWSIYSGSSYASISSGGYLTANNSTYSDQSVTVAASYTLNGITKTDYMVITVKGMAASVSLSSISISGSTSVSCDGTATYTCVATMSDGTKKTVYPVWTFAISDYASFSSSTGVLTAHNSTYNDQSVKIKAGYTENGVTRSSSLTVTIRAKTYTPPTTVSLASISISGSSNMTSGIGSVYTCAVTMSDGTTKTVSPVWGVDGGDGLFTVEWTTDGWFSAINNSGTPQSLTITASYTEGGVNATATKYVTVNATSSSSSGLTSISISGSSSIGHSATGVYVCNVTSSDGTVRAVSATWEIVSGTSYAFGLTERLQYYLLACNSTYEQHVVTISATYTENGVTLTATKSVTVEASCAHGSTYVQGAVAATCTTSGHTGKTVCYMCGDVLDFGSEIPALGHVEGEGVVVRAPTATEDGVMEFSCTRCGVVMRTEAIPRTNTGPTWTIDADGKLTRVELNDCTACEIPDGVTSIGNDAFSDCIALTSVTIPESVTNIGDNAFSLCGKLTSVMFLGDAPSVGLDCFDKVNDSCTVYVSRGSSGWNVPIPGTWNGLSIEYLDSPEPEGVVEPVISVDGIAVVGDSVVVTHDCTVTIACATEGATVYYSTDGSTPRPSNRFKYTGPFTIADTAEICAFAVLGDESSEFVTVTVTKVEPIVLTLADAVDCSTNTVTTGGDADWTPVEDATAVGGSSARSGAVSPEESTWMEMSVSGAGALSFSWKADCEKDPRGRYSYDCGAFSADGAVESRIDGTTEWQTVTVEIADGGTHTFRWTYIKDDYDEDDFEGEDCIWVDNVIWTPSAQPIQIPNVTTDDKVDSTIDSVGFADAVAVKKAIGGSAAEYGRFKSWAGSVKDVNGAAIAGEAVVVGNTNAAAAYLLGADRLFANQPKVELGNLAVGDEGVKGALTLSVTVKDGEDVVKCAAEKVKNLFEATSSLGDWQGEKVKLAPNVEILSGSGDTMHFKVTPGDGTAPSAFLRIRK